MDDVQLANYIAGVHPGPIEAGRTDHVIAQSLSVSPGTVVWLSDHTCTKTKYHHPEIDFRDYKMLPEILAHGFVCPGNKRRSVEICYVDVTLAKYRFWRVCLKATRRSEVFVDSLHRTDAKEFRRLYRRARKRQTLLRDHKNQLAQRLLRRASGA